MRCPHCGEALNTLDITFDASTGTVESGRAKTTLGPVQLHILECLIDAYPSGVDVVELANEVYGDKADEAADGGLNAVRASVLIIRRKLGAAGFPFEIGRVSSGQTGASEYVLQYVKAGALAKTA